MTDRRPSKTPALGGPLWILAALAACDGGPTQPSVVSIVVEGAATSLHVGENLQLSATPLDATGNPVPAIPLTWSSCNPSRATVSDDGLVSGVEEGNVAIRAQAGEITGQLGLVVLPVPVATVEVVPLEIELRRNQQDTLQAILRDGDGNELSGRFIQWSSDDTRVATVSSQGIVTGQGAGVTRILARSEDQEGSAQVTVEAGEIPVILSVTPDILRPGQEFTVSGERFGPGVQDNQVTVHGIEATVLEASEEFLTARLPGFICRPEGPAPVVVTANLEASDPLAHSFQPEATLQLAPGEFQRLTATDRRCLLLAPSAQGAEYVVGVQSTTEVLGVRTPIRLQGFAGQPLAAPVAMALAAASPELWSRSFASEYEARRIGRMDPGGEAAVLDGSPSTVPARDAERWARHRAAESELREAEARVLAPLLAFGGPARSGAESGPARVGAGTQEGDTVSVNVPDIATDNICQNSRSIRAVVRSRGERSIWIEDVENPSDGFVPADFELFAREFDDVIFDELASFFNPPTDIDGNGRVVVVVTRELNRMSGNILGFVSGADFFPQACPASNGGEFYYARVPDPDGTITDDEGESLEMTREDAVSDAPRLMTHEATHIIQFGRRFQMDHFDGAQSRWLLEGQATFAEEIMGHRYTGRRPGMNLGRSVAFGEGPPTDVSWYQIAFIDMAIFYGVGISGPGDFFRIEGTPERCSWFNVQDPDPCISGRIGYGVTWSLLRWLSDHFSDRFAGGDREFQQRIIESPRAGLETLEDVLGEDVRALMAPWAATHYTDGRTQNGDPLLTFPSWNLRNIEEGLVEEARLTPDERGFTAFQRDTEVAAGSSTYQVFRAEAGHPPFALSARTRTDGELPQFLQLWIARIR